MLYIFQAARKSQKFYHDDEIMDQIEETKELNDIKTNSQETETEDSGLSCSDFSKYHSFRHNNNREK